MRREPAGRLQRAPRRPGAAARPRAAAPGCGPRRLASALALAGSALLAGCSSVGYLGQSVTGHLWLLGQARPVGDWLGDPSTAPALRARLELSQRIRDFATRELELPDNASYRRYADLQRPAAVWNVVAAPELALDLRTWCFPVVGCVGYRGYFDQAAAERFADTLRAEGLDVNVYGVPAYSTLGRLPGAYFSDPLLNTFIDYPEGELARLVFHELAHQVVYAAGDTAFNESFATAVERIGGHRWLAAHADAAAREAFDRQDQRRADFQALTGRYREALLALYAEPLDASERRGRKAELYERLRAEYAQLRDGAWGGFGGYDRWFARANNASFGVLAAYTRLVPAFERLFERERGDFGRFYAEVRRLAGLPREQRQAELDALMPPEAGLTPRT